MSGVSQVVARYAADGAIAWAFVEPGGEVDPGVMVVFGLAAAEGGRVAFSGTFSGSVDFGGGALSADGAGHQAVVGFDADGTHRWSMRMGSLLQPGRPFIGSLPSGELVVAGRFEGNHDYGGGVLTLPAPGIFVLRFASE